MESLRLVGDAPPNQDRNYRVLRPAIQGTLDSLQIGKVAELRFASLAIAGSGGALEVVPPLADDERRDFEIHLKHRFGRPLSVQVKVASSLEPGQHLHIRFSRVSQVPIDPAYWFFCAHFDLGAMDFADPVFLIPSEVFRRRGEGSLQRMLSMSWRARDRWVRYRLTRLELGGRLVEIAGLLDHSPVARPHAVRVGGAAS